MALNAVLLQNTMQPEPVQPRLLDRDDRIALAGPDLRLAPELSKQRQKLGRITRRDAVLGHLLALAGRQRRHQPIRTAQFQRYKNCGNMRADSGRSVERMIERHRRLQVEWFQQPQSGFRLGRYPLPMESSSLTLLAMTGWAPRKRASGHPTGSTRAAISNLVMAGLVPGIHVFTFFSAVKAWMAGTSQATTETRIWS